MKSIGGVRLQQRDISMVFLAQGGRPLTKGERTRIHLIETAIETMSVYGFEEASISRLAERAGISRPLVVHYFPTKEDLLDQIVQYIALTGQTVISRACQGPHSAWEKLRTYYLANLQWAVSYPHHVSFWRYFIYRSGHSKKWRQFNDGFLNEGRRRMEGMVQEGVLRGEFHCKDVPGTVTILHRSLYLILLLHWKESSRATEQQVRQLIAFTKRTLALRD